MSALVLQPGLVQQLWFNLAELCWHLNSVAAPLLWLIAVGSAIGLFVTWRIGQMERARLFGTAGTLAVAIGLLLWALEAAAVYAAGLCL